MSDSKNFGNTLDKDFGIESPKNKPKRNPSKSKPKIQKNEAELEKNSKKKGKQNAQSINKEQTETSRTKSSSPSENENPQNLEKRKLISKSEKEKNPNSSSSDNDANISIERNTSITSIKSTKTNNTSISTNFEGVNEHNLPTSNMALNDPGSEEALLMAIRLCHKFMQPYFKIQSSVLLACLPKMDSNTENMLYNIQASQLCSQAYLSEHENHSAEAGGLYIPNFTSNIGLTGYQKLMTKRPHIYKMVTDAYFHLRRLEQNQLFILSGVSGSGKSKTENDILTQIGYLASLGNKHTTKKIKQMDAVSSIVEAFAHAATKESTSSTRCGIWREVQFNKRGRVIGHKLVVFGLDRWRTTGPPSKERNFNVFYYLIHGFSHKSMNKLQLSSDEEKYNYLKLETVDEILDPGQQENVKLPEISKTICIAMYDDLVQSLIDCGFDTKLINGTFQLLSAILHLGNCEFVDLIGVSEAASSKNRNELEITARLLGVAPRALETSLAYKTTMVGGDLCTVFMNSWGAARQRDEFARLLYHLLFMWLVDTLNKNLCTGESVNQIAILNMYGVELLPKTVYKAEITDLIEQASTFEQFMVNMANEQLYGYVLKEIFSNSVGISKDMSEDILANKSVPYIHRLDTLTLLCGKKREQQGGMVATMENHTCDKDVSENDLILLKTLMRYHGEHVSYIDGPTKKPKKNSPLIFGINHYMGPQKYSIDGFSKHNGDQLVSTDFISLFQQSSQNRFMQLLFGTDFIRMYLHPNKQSTVLEAHISSNLPTRPTVQLPVRHPGATPNNNISNTIEMSNRIVATELELIDVNNPPVTQIAEVSSAMNNIFAACDTYKSWHVIHLRPDDPQRTLDTLGKEKPFDKDFVGHQIVSLAVNDISEKRDSKEFTISIKIEDFLSRYSELYKINTSSAKVVQIDDFANSCGWKDREDYIVGKSKIYIAEEPWQQLEIRLRAKEKKQSSEKKITRNNKVLFDMLQDNESANRNKFEEKQNEIDGCENDDENSDREEIIRNIMDDVDIYYGEPAFEDNDSSWEYDKFDEGEEHIEDIPTTYSRKCWSNTAEYLTLWIPKSILKKGGMKRPDIQMAWREKVAICILIGFLWMVLLFFIVGLGLIMCPKQYVYGIDEVSSHVTKDDAYIALRGNVYDITNFINVAHGFSRGGATIDDMIYFAGHDVNASFPLSIRSACPELVTEKTDPNWKMYPKNDPETDALFPFIHRAGMQTGEELPNQNFYFDYVVPKLALYKKGELVWKPNFVDQMHKKYGKYWRILNGEVFNLNGYFETKNALENAGQRKWSYLNTFVETVFDDGGARNTDITNYWNRIPIARNELDANYKCLKRLFYVGKVDTRKSFRCLFPNYLLLAFACALMLVILIKFLASLQLTPRRKPQKHDKFVICQVPCYTEGEDSLKKTINGLSLLNYDDKHKLLFIICDGNIVGSGNDRPTPRIVLDILGVDLKLEPMPLSFKAIGEGSKQHNMAKVYAGLYQFEGHIVPYIVVAKIGKPSEKSRPGNRGKRDSQMILLHFLNKVHFDLPMSPLDLEIYHQMKNVIGIHPNLYEYILMVDADTVVSPESLNRLVACMVHDSKVVGICGETKISNEDYSWTTMIQVYEYFISHHMAKAFESIFGSVTCLPGCFSMYRVRSPNGAPLIVSKEIVRDYSENIVDTLHKKNLLSLGEDRYLTTLIMKYFPQYKTKFTNDATCKTTVPDSWSVLLSQRRRWINSTIHNLVELVFLPELCGFCFFSMRFVVFIDLFGTLTMPCTVVYLLYLLYLTVSKTADVGYISLILIGVIYGFQAIIFILRRQWQHIGWMIIYILAYPLWSFYIPIYSFWHFDDFSWGNTRIVVGEGGKRQLVVSEKEKFNPAEIPMRTWSEHESILLEKHHHIQAMGMLARDIEIDLENSVEEIELNSNSDNVRFYNTGSPYSHGHEYGSNLYHTQSMHGEQLFEFLNAPENIRVMSPAPQAQDIHQNYNEFNGQIPVSSTPEAIFRAPSPFIPVVEGENGLQGNPAPYYNAHTPAQYIPVGLGSGVYPENDVTRSHFVNLNEHNMAASASMIQSNQYMDRNVDQVQYSQNMYSGSQNGNNFYNNPALTPGLGPVVYGMPNPTFHHNWAPMSPQLYDHSADFNPHFVGGQQIYQQYGNGVHMSNMNIPGNYNEGNNDMQSNGDIRLPLEAEIEVHIKSILGNSDLNQITIKQVRQTLEQIFGADLSSKRDFINKTIQDYLQG
ncbi:hypothetical protein BB559_006129 [Furculomyces boomerangus]|uniref:chitin synthase n=1 Tax=Furculomyces boomerangus TaxID=61424 RepID=A0A2T9Y4T7_9FUNG|nr:hypothetical protein BB559_006129 [Furculomyces boomerangus]